MKHQKTLMGLLTVMLALFFVIPKAWTADYSLGGGIGIAPDYEGSEDYQAVPVPFGRINFDNGMFVTLEGPKLKANLIPSGFWRLGPVYNYRPSRGSVENDAVDDMKNVSDANELGIFGGINWQNWYLTLDLLGDTGNAHDGWYGLLKGGYNWIVSNDLALTFGAHTTYANEDYMETYFGVSGRDSARSGLDRYNADEGIKDVGMDLGLNLGLAKNWSMLGIVDYTRLVGDADDDSPVVDEGNQNQFFGALLVIYHFGGRKGRKVDVDSHSY